MGFSETAFAVEDFAEHFSADKLIAYDWDMSKTKWIPRPPHATYCFPRKYDGAANKVLGEEDKSQIPLCIGKENSWQYRSLIDFREIPFRFLFWGRFRTAGYVASIKKEVVQSANTETAYNMQIVRKLPWWDRDAGTVHYSFTRVDAYSSGYTPRAYSPEVGIPENSFFYFH